MMTPISKFPAVVLFMAVSCMSSIVTGQDARVRRDEEMRTTVMAYPTGDRNTSTLLLERQAPQEVRVGEQFTYALRVTNLTDQELRDVVITEEFPAGFDPRTTAPATQGMAAGRAQWRFAVMGRKASEVIRVEGVATKVGALPTCATVTFETRICSTTQVVDPRLDLVLRMPPDVILCDTIPLRLVVTNPGSGLARNVKVRDNLPEGWTTPEGNNSFVLDVGDLGPGQSREFTVNLKASRPGQFVNSARATADGDLTADASATTHIRQPVLVVSKSGPDVRLLGRPAVFEITVTNQGDGPARDTVLVDDIPAGTDFIEAGAGGRFASGKVTWGLGTIEPGGSRKVTVALKPTQIGRFQNTAVAKAYCAEGRAIAAFAAQGIPGLLLEVLDVADPIEIGAQETYVITVTNQGSAPGTNLVVTGTLPPEMDYVSSEGPTQARVEGKTVRFAPVQVLAPKAKISYRIVVRGNQAGDIRFKVGMTSDQTQEPVEETESTHVY